MLVKFKNAWFGPSVVTKKGPWRISGMRFKRGIQEVPEELRAYLPMEIVEILDDNTEEVEVVEVDERQYSLSELDPALRAAEMTAQVFEKAEVARKAGRPKKRVLVPGKLREAAKVA